MTSISTVSPVIRTFPAPIDLGPRSSKGCGDSDSWWVPDRIGPWDMRAACDQHDKDWEKTGLADRLAANMKFRWNILKDTGNPMLASIYGGAVDIAAIVKSGIIGKAAGAVKAGVVGAARSIKEGITGAAQRVADTGVSVARGAKKTAKRAVKAAKSVVKKLKFW